MAEPKATPVAATASEALKLGKQYAEAREAARTAIVESISKQIAELKELEFEYTLTEGAVNGTAKGKHTCSNCGEGGHSARTCQKPKK